MIKVSKVSKWYSKVRALDNVSFDFKEGEIVGIVGPNGSGKSTLIKTIIGLLHSDEGKIEFNEPAPQAIGYLPEVYRYSKYLTGYDILEGHSILCNVSKNEILNGWLVKKFGMKDYLGRKTSTYSKGQLKKIGIAKTFIGSPSILILDEPFEGLDTLDRDYIVKMFKNYHSDEKCIIVSTHILHELEELCDRVVFLKKGIKAFDVETKSLSKLSLVSFREDQFVNKNIHLLNNEFGVLRKSQVSTLSKEEKKLIIVERLSLSKLYKHYYQ